MRQVPKNFKLLAVPLFELFDNVQVPCAPSAIRGTWRPTCGCFQAVAVPVPRASCLPHLTAALHRLTPAACPALPQRYGHGIAAIPQSLSRLHLNLHAPPEEG